MSGRLLVFFFYLVISFSLVACQWSNEEELLREQFAEAVKNGEDLRAISKFSVLHSQFPVSTEELFEAAWLALFCVRDFDLAALYFSEMDAHEAGFNNVFKGIEVLHLGAWVVCASGESSRCVEYIEESLVIVSNFDETQTTYLRQYVDDMVYLRELALLDRSSEAVLDDRFLSVCSNM